MLPARRIFRRSSRRPASPVLAVGVALAVLGLAACASATEGGGDGGADGGATTSPPGATDEPSDGPTWEDPSQSGDEGEPPALAPDAAAMPLEAGAHGRGLPPGLDAPVDGGTGAAWSAEPGLLYVVTYGSSSCPLVAEPEAAVRDGAVVVTFVEIPPDTVCTMDYVPATSVVAVPSEVDASAEVSVELEGEGTVVVPPAAQGATGAAAWVALP